MVSSYVDEIKCADTGKTGNRIQQVDCGLALSDTVECDSEWQGGMLQGPNPQGLGKVGHFLRIQM